MKHTQNVMDHTGHTPLEFDTADKVSVAEAEKRFKELTGRGFLAFEVDGSGTTGRQLKAFDPNVETTNFTPALQGG